MLPRGFFDWLIPPCFSNMERVSRQPPEICAKGAGSQPQGGRRRGAFKLLTWCACGRAAAPAAVPSYCGLIAFRLLGRDLQARRPAKYERRVLAHTCPSSVFGAVTSSRPAHSSHWHRTKKSRGREAAKHVWPPMKRPGGARRVEERAGATDVGRPCVMRLACEGGPGRNGSPQQRQWRHKPPGSPGLLPHFTLASTRYPMSGDSSARPSILTCEDVRFALDCSSGPIGEEGLPPHAACCALEF